MREDNIKKYAIILIYSDGFIEKVEKDKKDFHMEYFVELSVKSSRFKQFVIDKQIYIPEIEEAKLMLTYEIDRKLAEDGIIAIHNLFLNEEVRNEFSDYACDYYISLPNELSINQKDIFGGIMEDYDISNCWFGTFNGTEMIDRTYDDIKKMIDKKRK